MHPSKSDRKQDGSYWPGGLGHYPLSAIKTWQTKITTVHKERDQDLMRLETMSHKERLKETEVFAPGSTR